MRLVMKSGPSQTTALLSGHLVEPRDQVYATVRLPEPEGKRIVAVGWAVYPTLAIWNWPGREGKQSQFAGRTLSRRARIAPAAVRMMLRPHSSNVITEPSPGAVSGIS